MSIRYIITGASGHLGSTLLKKLSGADCAVSALHLPGEEEKVHSENIEYVTGNICQPDTLLPLFEHSQQEDTVVIHTAGIVSIQGKASQKLYETNVQGTKNLLQLCRSFPIKRFVYVSSVHAIPELPQGQTISEVSSFSPDSVIGDYAKSKARASQAVLDAAEDGLDAVIVHPSGIVGPYDAGKNHLIQLVQDTLDGKLPACVRGGYDFVDVRDVADGCIAAAERGKKGNCYILSGHYATIEKFLSYVSTASGCALPPVLPMWCARVAAPFIESFAKLRKIRPLYTGYALYTLRSNGLFSNRKAEKQLGYKPRSLEATVRDTVRWLRRSKQAVYS